MYIQPDMINPSSSRGVNRFGHPKSINPNIEPWLHPYLKAKKMNYVFEKHHMLGLFIQI